MESTVKDLYLSSYQKLEKEISGKDPVWLKSLRGKALAHFGEIGFPTTKNESWKYTDLTTSLLKTSFTFENETSTKTVALTRLKSLGFKTDQAHVLVFVNGRFDPEQSALKGLPKGVKLQSLAAVLPEVEKSLGQIAPLEGRAFTALNAAYFTDGLFLSIPQGQVLSEPVHVVYLSANAGKNTQSHPRNLLLLEDDSRATVIEHYWGDNAGATLTNAVTEVRLSKGAQLDHLKIQQESGNSYHVGSLVVKQDEGSRFSSRLFSLGGVLTRHEVETTLGGKKAECLLEGLYLAKGQQQVDTRTFVDHLSPSCKSEEVFKGVLDGEATAIFDGHVLVRENAQKTDARQSNKNLQLSKVSKVYSKPQLQIYADDVKCSHGSATGQLDEEALFYFQSRGIGREEAKRTLVNAFAGEMVERAGLDYLKVPLSRMVGEWMENHGH
jgi:Fe-S cluster assembly protein SufD